MLADGENFERGMLLKEDEADPRDIFVLGRICNLTES